MKKTKAIMIRLTDDEQAAVSAKAKRLGHTLSSWVRYVILEDVKTPEISTTTVVQTTLSAPVVNGVLCQRHKKLNCQDPRCQP